MIDDIYTADRVTEIVAALPPLDADKQEKFPDLLRAWARRHSALLEGKPPTPFDKTLGKLEKELERAIRSLAELDAETRARLASHVQKSEKLEKPGLASAAFAIEGHARLNTSMIEIERLRQWVSESIPAKKRGPRPKVDRDLAVLDLAWMFFYLTGKNPTRIYDPYKETEYGPFRDFVIKVLEPFPIVSEGVSTAIKKVGKAKPRFPPLYLGAVLLD